MIETYKAPEENEENWWPTTSEILAALSDILIDEDVDIIMDLKPAPHEAMMHIRKVLPEYGYKNPEELLNSRGLILWFNP
jgi:hypothetical protein